MSIGQTCKTEGYNHLHSFNYLLYPWGVTSPTTQRKRTSGCQQVKVWIRSIEGTRSNLATSWLSNSRSCWRRETGDGCERCRRYRWLRRLVIMMMKERNRCLIGSMQMVQEKVKHTYFTRRIVMEGYRVATQHLIACIRLQSTHAENQPFFSRKSRNNTKIDFPWDNWTL